MTLPSLNLENQFGEVSKNVVLPSSTLPGAEPIAATSVVANLTAGAIVPVAVTLQAFQNKAPAKAGVTAITALATPVVAVTVTTAGGNTYSDAAINTALAALVADLQTQLTQMNAILAQLKVVS